MNLTLSDLYRIHVALEETVYTLRMDRENGGDKYGVSSTYINAMRSTQEKIERLIKQEES